MTFVKNNPVAALLLVVGVAFLLWVLVSTVFPIIKLVLMIIGAFTVVRWVLEVGDG